jgi:hypothetical protein
MAKFPSKKQPNFCPLRQFLSIREQVLKNSLIFVHYTVNLGFEMVPEKGSGQTARNAFVKMNWNNGALVWLEREEGVTGVDAPKDSKDGSNGLTGEWAVVPQRLVLANGPRYIGRGMTSTVRGLGEAILVLGEK